jgi:hypothetical protein
LNGSKKTASDENPTALIAVEGRARVIAVEISPVRNLSPIFEK